MADETRTADRRPIGFWLKLLDRLIDERFDALVGGEGLTRRHWQVLNVLRREPATVAEVDAAAAPFLHDGEPTTRPVVADLQNRGWVACDGGGRAALTEAGAAAHTRLLEQVAAQRQHITAGVGAQEYGATVAVLRRMATNLGWSEPDA